MNQQKTYHACIFDLDGTLVNTLASIAYFSNAALLACGYSRIELSSYKTIVGDGAEMQVRRMLNHVKGENTWTEEDLAKLRRLYYTFYSARPLNLSEVYPGMKHTLEALRKAGLKTAVLSNKPHAWTKAIIEGLYPAGTFDLCYGQRPQVPRKPAPDGALLIARELGVEPDLCLYIGDTNTDMKTGAAAGMDTAGALWGFRTRRELEECHARYLLNKPEDLISLISGGCMG